MSGEECERLCEPLCVNATRTSPVSSGCRLEVDQLEGIFQTPYPRAIHVSTSTMSVVTTGAMCPANMIILHMATKTEIVTTARTFRLKSEPRCLVR